VQRKAPLKRKTKLVRKTWIKRSEFKPRRKKPDIPNSVRRAVYQRSNGRCELRVPGVCTGRAAEIDHTKNRSQLGPHTLDNLRHSCAPCHRWKTENPNAAHDLGIYRRAWE
jgi:hypothetical protein